MTTNVHVLRRIASRELILALAIAAVPGVPRDAVAQTVEWRTYAASNAGTKYSAVDQINRDT